MGGIELAQSPVDLDAISSEKLIRALVDTIHLAHPMPVRRSRELENGPSAHEYASLAPLFKALPRLSCTGLSAAM